MPGPRTAPTLACFLAGATLCLGLFTACGQIEISFPDDGQTPESTPPPSQPAPPPRGGGGEGAPPPAPAPPDRPAPPAAGPPSAGPPASGAVQLSARDRDFLRRSLQGLRQLEGAIGDVGAERFSHGALAAAALGDRAETARLTRAALAACRARPDGNDCQRGRLSLLRVGLDFPEALPGGRSGELGRQLVAFLGQAAAPPSGTSAEPWGFRETENQRMVIMAWSLGGLVLSGQGQSPAARGWSRHAEAFLVARDRQGWYEQDSPGYLGISVEALLLLADHAPTERVRDLAWRQLAVLFASWAQNQVAGFPAGAKTRTYVHWALGPENTPWQSWYWLVTGRGDPRRLNFRDFPALAASRFEVPEPAVRLLERRTRLGSDTVRERRRFTPTHRRDMDAAIASRVTPAYVLSASQAVEGLALGISGGQEIMGTLYPEGADFAPLYLWSRSTLERSDRWKSFTGQDQTALDDDVLLARLGTGDAAAVGHVYLAPAWGRPRPAGEDGDVLVARAGRALVALTTAGGWEVARAPERFPAVYGGNKNIRDAWVAVPRRQPAWIALEAAPAAAVSGGLEAWGRRLGGVDLTVDGSTLRYRDRAGRALAFTPGRRLSVAGRRIDPRPWPVLAGPAFSSRPGGWRFDFDGIRYTFDPVAAPRRP